MARVFISLIFYGLTLSLSATHIKGGYISYKQLSSNTFEFTFVGYRDSDGVLFGNGVFDFGDGTQFGGLDGDPIPWELPIDNINSEIELWTFKLTHTYSGSGTYVVSFTEDFRTETVANIAGSTSTPFYIEASVAVDPLLGFNSSPRHDPQVFYGIVGDTYYTSFVTADPDGDSLSYHLTTPEQDNSTHVEGYRFPNNIEFNEDNTNTFSLHPISGNLVWETEGIDIIPPNESREFTIAIKVVQWRAGIQVGFTTLDYNIELWNPELPVGQPFLTLDFPESKCYDSGSSVLMDTIEIQNLKGSTLEISFDSIGAGFSIDELSVQEWNNQNKDSNFSDEAIRIPVQFDPNLTTSDYSSLLMKLSYVTLIGDTQFPLELNQHQALFYGENCEFNFVLHAEELDEMLYKIEKGGISFSPVSAVKKVIVSDLTGNIVLEKLVSNSETIEYKFERNTIYLLTLVSNEEITTHKFLFK